MIFNVYYYYLKTKQAHTQECDSLNKFIAKNEYPFEMYLEVRKLVKSSIGKDFKGVDNRILQNIGLYGGNRTGNVKQARRQEG